MSKGLRQQANAGNWHADTDLVELSGAAWRLTALVGA